MKFTDVVGLDYFDQKVGGNIETCAIFCIQSEKCRAFVAREVPVGKLCQLLPRAAMGSELRFNGEDSLNSYVELQDFCASSNGDAKNFQILESKMNFFSIFFQI